MNGLTPELMITALTLFTASLIWLIRLESKTNQVARDLDRLEERHDDLMDKHDNLDDKVMLKLAEMATTLARIDERFSYIEQSLRGETWHK